MNSSVYRTHEMVLFHHSSKAQSLSPRWNEVDVGTEYILRNQRVMFKQRIYFINILTYRIEMLTLSTVIQDKIILQAVPLYRSAGLCLCSLFGAHYRCFDWWVTSTFTTGLCRGCSVNYRLQVWWIAKLKVIWYWCIFKYGSGGWGLHATTL